MYTCHCVGGLFSQWFLGLQTSYIQNFIMGLYPFSFLFLVGKNYHRFTGIFRNNMGRSCIHFSPFFSSYIVTVLCLNQNYFLEQCVFTVVSFHCMCRFVQLQPQSRQRTMLSRNDLPLVTISSYSSPFPQQSTLRNPLICFLSL